jgi:hypothetical protein
MFVHDMRADVSHYCVGFELVRMAGDHELDRIPLGKWWKTLPARSFLGGSALVWRSHGEACRTRGGLRDGRQCRRCVQDVDLESSWVMLMVVQQVITALCRGGRYKKSPRAVDDTTRVVYRPACTHCEFLATVTSHDEEAANGKNGAEICSKEIKWPLEDPETDD